VDISVDAVKICSDRKLKENENYNILINLPGEREPIYIKDAKSLYTDLPARVKGVKCVFSILAYEPGKNHRSYERIQSYINDITRAE